MTEQSLSEYIGGELNHYFTSLLIERRKDHYVALIAPISIICDQNVICTLIGIHGKS